MSARALAVLAVAATSCSARPALPPGPPPEYERSPVLPWDAGRATDDDPLGHAAEGEWTGDDEPRASDDAGPPRPERGGALSSDGGVG